MEKTLGANTCMVPLFLQCFIQAIHQHFKGFGPAEPFQLVPFFLLAAGALIQLVSSGYTARSVS